MKKILPSAKELAVFTDDRGVFVPFLQTKSLENGLEIKRIYYVYNHSKGVIRGFHFHKNEWKYFTVVSGAAKFIALNPDKPKETFTFISSTGNQILLLYPQVLQTDGFHWKTIQFLFVV